MLKKQLTILVLLVMAAGVFAQSIPSGTGRYEALGNSPFILDAATDINNNPAWVSYYRNYGFGDVGRSILSDFELSDQWGGFTMSTGKQLTLGLVVNKTEDNWGDFNSNSWGTDSSLRPSYLGISDPIVPIKILFGYSANKNLHLGLAPYFRMWSSSYSSSDTNIADYDRSSSSLGASLGIISVMKNGWVEGAVNFRMNKYKSEVTLGSTTTTTENEGGIRLSAGLRGWFTINKSNKLAFVPYLGFATYSWNPKQTSGSTTTNGMSYSSMNLTVGFGLNLPVVDDIQVAGGLSLGYDKEKADSNNVTLESSEFVLPKFNLAAEWSIADWLTARAGFERYIRRRTSNSTYTSSGSTTTNEWKWTDASSGIQTIAIGAGFHFGRFSLDATVSEKWLKEGINFVSGGDTDLFGVISMSYNFNR